MSAFLLPALRSTLGNILRAIIILLFFLNRVFSYKTRIKIPLVFCYHGFYISRGLFYLFLI